MRQEKKIPEEALFEKPREAIAFDKMTNLHQFAQELWLLRFFGGEALWMALFEAEARASNAASMLGAQLF